MGEMDRPYVRGGRCASLIRVLGIRVGGKFCASVAVIVGHYCSYCTIYTRLEPATIVGVKAAHAVVIHATMKETA